MAVQIVDALEMVEIDQRQTVNHTRLHVVEFAGSQTQKMPAVEQPGQLIGGHQIVELAHHAAQGVLMRLQGKPALAHALS